MSAVHLAIRAAQCLSYLPDLLCPDGIDRQIYPFVADPKCSHYINQWKVPIGSRDRFRIAHLNYELLMEHLWRTHDALESLIERGPESGASDAASEGLAVVDAVEVYVQHAEGFPVREELFLQFDRFKGLDDASNIADETDELPPTSPRGRDRAVERLKQLLNRAFDLFECPILIAAARIRQSGIRDRPAARNRESPGSFQEAEEERRETRRNKNSAFDLEAMALALLAKNPDWPVSRLADELGVARSSLYRIRLFKEAIKCRGRRHSRPPRGSISRDGRIEAIGDADIDHSEIDKRLNLNS